MCNPENKIISSFPSFITILKFGFFNLFDFKVLCSLADEKFHMKNRGKQFSLDRTWGPWVAFSPIKTFTNLTPHLWIIMTLNIIFGQQVLCTRNTLWPSTCRMWLKLSSMFEWRGGWVYFISGIIQCCCVSVPGTGMGKSGNAPSAPSSGSCWLESCAWALSMESQGRALSSCPVPHCSSAPCLGTGMSQGRGEAKENNLPLFSLFSWWSPVTLYIIH